MRDYSRQPILDMQKIGSAKITIVGSGMLTNYLCLYMTTFGIRELKIIDSENGKEEFLTNDKRRNRAEQLAEKLVKISSEMNVKVRKEIDDLTLGKPDVLVEFTNDKRMQEICRKYSERAGTPLISGASDEDNGSLCVGAGGICSLFAHRTLSEYDGRKQGTFTSGIISAIALDEIRKIINPLEDDNKLKGRVDFSLHKKNRFNQGNEFQGKYVDVSKLKALVVGAGGIGTYVALNLALMDIGEIDIVDGDKIEEHNLNRQALYYGKIGENKAKVLSGRLREFSKVRINALQYYLKDESQIKKSYDIIFSCLDNWEWRFRLSNYSLRKGINFINGAVSTFTARAEFSDCLECKYNKEELIAEQKNEKVSCNNLSSNVVMTNALVGALMASEAKAIAMPSRYKTLKGKEIRYNSKNEDSKKFVVLEGSTRCLYDRKKGCVCHDYR